MDKRRKEEKKEKAKRPQETFESDVYYLKFDNGIISECIFLKPSNCIHSICVDLVY